MRCSPFNLTSSGRARLVTMATVATSGLYNTDSMHAVAAGAHLWLGSAPFLQAFGRDRKIGVALQLIDRRKGARIANAVGVNRQLAFAAGQTRRRASNGTKNR